MLRAISTRWLWTNLVTLLSMTSVSSPSDLALICQMRESVKAWTSFLPAEWPYPLMLTGEPKDALHQLRTRVCSLLFIVRGYCAPEIGIRDGAGARGRITHQCEPASVPGLGSNELWSHWWVIRAFIPAHNAITYGCSLKMSTKRVVSFVKKKVSVKSQELYSM